MNHESGQGLIEYAIVLVFVVVILIGGWLLLGASLVAGVQAGNPVSIFIAVFLILSALTVARRRRY
ncbi:hypothetical protein HYZ70_02915 [Candidatus Curtissbacteria bacterium]|nr:hypothetical protein [Candidatus Curtissbacteria bacterium]